MSFLRNCLGVYKLTMKKQDLIKNMHKALSKIDLVYYDLEKVETKGYMTSWIYFNIEFTLPWHSLQNLVEFCKLNDFCLSYNMGVVEITVYNPTSNKKFKIPKNLI